MPGAGEWLVIFMILGAVGFWLWTLVDCATKEPPEGSSRVIWILIIVIGNMVGALLYLLVRRPRRKKLHEQ